MSEVVKDADGNGDDDIEEYRMHVSQRQSPTEISFL